MTVITRECITNLLRTNDLAVGRALVALNARQTDDEQRDAETRYLNRKGFMTMHAARGTGMAKFFMRTGFLTQKQLEWWRRPVGRKPRIERYVTQLMVIAKESGRQVQF